MATIIDGKALAAELRAALKPAVQRLAARGARPGLAALVVGDDAASRVYVRNKVRACEETGVRSESHELPAQAAEREILERVTALNADPRVHGILVQLPLPPQIDAARVIEAIDPAKDVDGFHPINVGRLFSARGALDPTLLVPCTPRGCLILVQETLGRSLAGKRVVVVGRSNIVGKPVALMCLAKNATVTLCHSRTRNLPEQVRRADVLIAAVGRPEMIKGEWIKPGAVVIDVGVNRVGEKKLVGDVEFEAAKERASAITPVPGGVGPMTITMLLYNTVESARRRAAQKR